MTGYADLRARLENNLLALVDPDRFRWVPTQTKIDRPAKPTLMLKLGGVTRSTVAQGVLVPTFVLTVVSEHLDPSQADVALDELLDDLLAPIQSLRWVAFRGAEKVSFQTKYMAYDLQLEALTAIKRGA
ncbi:hypothetical protein [Microbacterium kyungheense]|uniref:Tail terminator n=1 Tax=Microbacterium kyungheense TaxID=1263636 RepID=A0A543EU59_9MICO|nr:hypothetical protein [Microbacterium kyungheense]TQM25113.1 hypothetical protein FB391_2572 [Microbacterium kyungheense]